MLYHFFYIDILASPAIKSQLQSGPENAATQSLLVEALNGVQTIKENAENTVSGDGSAAILHL